MKRLSCLVLAAGSSSRMGEENKLLLTYNGESFLRRTVREACASNAHEVIVVTGHQSEKVVKELTDLPAKIVHNEFFASGMHSSIRCGVEALSPETQGFYICLSDQPHFKSETLKILSDQFNFSGGICAPVHNGRRGHPVLISAEYIPEILAYTDGDYGCSYLFKNHPQDIFLIETNEAAVTSDIDTPEDYRNLQGKKSPDATQDFYNHFLQLRRSDRPFALATVVEVIGSASARAGDKALFNERGENVIGYVGGGCAERFVAEESLAAIKEGKPRTVLADLDDEILGLGVACGGQMKVFIDPQLPLEEIPTTTAEKFAAVVGELKSLYGWRITPKNNSTEPTCLEDLLVTLAADAAKKRQRTGKSLRHTKLVPAEFIGRYKGKSKKVAIVGQSRITESLAHHFNLLNYDVRILSANPNESSYASAVKCVCLENGYDEVRFESNEIVIIASHTRQDPMLVSRAISDGAAHIAMVGSKKRSLEVLAHLDCIDQKVHAPLYVPAGLDIEAKNPGEIALSIVAEIIKEGRQ